MSINNVICLGASGWECSGVWVVMALLFFAAAILKKQLDENFGLEFSLPISAVASILGFAITFIIFSNVKWGFAVGIVLVFVGGFAGPFIPYIGGDYE